MRDLFEPSSDRSQGGGGRRSRRASGLVIGTVLFGSLFVTPAVSASASTTPTGSSSAVTPDETKLKIRDVPVTGSGYRDAEDVHQGPRTEAS